jgi:filamentous hemagglutinin
MISASAGDYAKNIKPINSSKPKADYSEVYRKYGEETGEAKNLWGKWSDYKKVTIKGREYAKIGDKYYTRHAVDRMQPSGMRYTTKGSVDGGKVGASRILNVGQVDYGRSISPNFVEDVITKGKLIDTPVINGVERQIWKSGTVEVVTEGDIIITIMTK